jgi:hypothetical protein
VEFTSKQFFAEVPFLCPVRISKVKTGKIRFNMQCYWLHLRVRCGIFIKILTCKNECYDTGIGCDLLIYCEIHFIANSDRNLKAHNVRVTFYRLEK